MDFGFELGCPPSLIKQKLHDHPRSIETASCMLVLEWWESLQIPRDQKYSVLLDAVRSTGKLTTAVQLQRLLEERMLGRERLAQGHTQLQLNCHALVKSASDTQIVPQQAVSGEFRDTRSGTPNGALSHFKIYSRKGFAEFNGRTSIDIFEEIDVADPDLDLDVFNNRNRSTEREILQTGVMIDQVGVGNNQTGVANDQTDLVNGKTGVVKNKTNVVNGQTSVVNDQTGVANGKTGIVNGQTGVENGQTGVVNDQTGVANGKIGVVNGQTGVANGQTGVRKGQTDVVSGCSFQRRKDHLRFLRRISRLFWSKKRD